MSCSITIKCCCENKQKILSGHGAPAANPGVDYALYTNLDDGVLFYWDHEDSTWN